jgi:hypothetical protein
LFVTTGGNDMMDIAKTSNPFKMGNQLRTHIRKATVMKTAGRGDDSDEEDGEVLDKSFSGGDGGGIFGFFHRITHKRKSSYK